MFLRGVADSMREENLKVKDKPVWLDDYPVLGKLLIGCVRRHDKGVNRPSISVNKKNIPELYDFNCEDPDPEFLWSLITTLGSEFDVFDVRLRKVKVYEPIYENAKLFFNGESLGLLKSWLEKDLKPKPKKIVSFYHTQKWKRLRLKAFEVCGTKCQCCGRSSPEVILDVDHIKPRSKYPELELKLDNLQILCRECNQGKSNITDVDFR